MAILRQRNWLGQQRVDAPHLRAVENSITADFDLLAGKIMVGNRPVVATGFTISTSFASTPVVDYPFGAGHLASGLRLIVAGGAIMHPTASESGTLFVAPDDAEDEVLDGTNPNLDGAFAPSQTNYVGLDLRRSADDSTSDTVMFLDADTLQESPRVVPLARTMSYRISISTTPFESATHILPIATVLTDTSNNVVILKDARNLFFRLGEGGSSPDPQHTYPWPNGRREFRVDDYDPSQVSTAVFSGGDKAISSQKEWNQAIMTRLWELGGGDYWYSNNSDREVQVSYGPVTTLADNFIYIAGSPDGTLKWESIKITFANSTGFFNDVLNNIAGLPIADGECYYVDIDRTTNATVLEPVRSSLTEIGTSTHPGSRFVLAWRIGAVVYARDRSFEVGRPFVVPATDTLTGVVRLTYPALNPAIPLVAPVDVNGTIKHTATVNNNPGLQGTGLGTGTGVIGVGGVTNGVGVRGTGVGTGNGVTGIAGTSAGAAGVAGFASGASLIGVSGSGSATGPGVQGTGGSTGPGVTGTGGSTSGSGVIGTGTGTGQGVVGNAPNTTGTGGVLGIAGSSAANNTGVIGLGTGTALGSVVVPTGAGVYGHGAISGNGPGVLATGTGTSPGLQANALGTGPGVQGTVSGASATGVVGVGGSSNGTGVQGTGGGTGFGVSGTGGSSGGTGVVGTAGAGNGIGVLATGTGSGEGVRGQGGPTGFGVLGTGGATSGVGVRGVGGPASAGVQGQGTGDGAGVSGTGGTGAGSAASSAGIRGIGGSAGGQGVLGSPSIAGYSGVMGLANGVAAPGGAADAGVRGVGSTGAIYGVLGEAGSASAVRGTTTGTGAGVEGVGGVAGSTAIGVRGVGGTTGGAGVSGVGTAGSASGVEGTGATNGLGVLGTGTGTGAGVRGVAGAGTDLSITADKHIQVGSGAVATTTGYNNQMTKANIIHAWGNITAGNSATGTTNAGFNIATGTAISATANTLTITLTTSMPANSIAVITLQGTSEATTDTMFFRANVSGNTLVVRRYLDTGAISAWTGGAVTQFGFMIIGIGI